MEPSRREFEVDEVLRIVERSLRGLPPPLRDALDNVGIFIEDRPPKRTLKKLRIERDGVLLGLFEGVPRTKRTFDGAAQPSRITLYLESARALARGARELEEILVETLYHELGHYFGMEEEELEE